MAYVTVESLARCQLDRHTIASARRLQQRVFNPDPNWDGSLEMEQFIPLQEAELKERLSASELDAQVDYVKANNGTSDERWHIVRDPSDASVLAKAHTFTRALTFPDGPRTVLALTGVNTHPDHRGKGLGAAVVRAAFGQLDSLPDVNVCLFQTGSAMPFYTEIFGCREVSKPDIYLGGSGGELAFTDVHVLIYPGSASWPDVGSAVDAQGYTGSWPWWEEEVCGSLPPLGQLGWRGPHRYDDPDVCALREQLKAEAGIAGLEIVSPSEQDFAKRAAAIFRRDGFVIVSDCLNDQEIEAVRRGCEVAVRDVCEKDPQRLGNRGSHRYSFAGSHKQSVVEFSVMADSQPVLEVLAEIFESPDYTCDGVGGDFVLPGCVQYQHLHMDMGEYLADSSGKLSFLDMPTSRVQVNFPLTLTPGSAVAHTVYNGATRQIPGTQNSHESIPWLEEDLDAMGRAGSSSTDAKSGSTTKDAHSTATDLSNVAQEPKWMKLNVTAPAPAGCALIRDLRAWHGGTPNLSKEVRAIPGAGFSAPWFQDPEGKQIPRSVWEQMSERGRHVTRYIVRDDDTIDTSWMPDWDVVAGIGGGGVANQRHVGTPLAKL